MTDEIWYRYEEVRYAAPVDEWDIPMGKGRLELRLLRLPVRRHTPKGVWLETGSFVRKQARKRYAYPTEAEAKEAFIARKRAQIRILNAQLEHAREALALLACVPIPPLEGSAYAHNPDWTDADRLKSWYEQLATVEKTEV